MSNKVVIGVAKTFEVCGGVQIKIIGKYQYPNIVSLWNSILSMLFSNL
jgi:hypothetical protein